MDSSLQPSTTTTTTATTATATATTTPHSSPFLPHTTTAIITSTQDTVQLVVLCLVGVVAFLANLVVIVTILMTRKLRTTSSSVLVCSLAAADLAVTSLVVPLAACGLVYQRWVFSQVTCTMTGVLSGVFSAASALSVAIIAVDRYLAILHCLRYSVWPRWRYVLLMLALTWTPALLFGALRSTRAATVTYVPELYVCDVMAASSPVYVSARALLVFCLPLALLVFAYARVIHVARTHSRKIDVVVSSRPRRGSNNESPARGRSGSESVSPNGAVAAGAMFSVRKLSIMTLPGRGGVGRHSNRRHFHISGDVELVTDVEAASRALAACRHNNDVGGGGAGGCGDAAYPRRRFSCTSFKLVLLVAVFAACCGLHSAVSLFEAVFHHQESADYNAAAAAAASAGRKLEPQVLGLNDNDNNASGGGGGVVVGDGGGSVGVGVGVSGVFNVTRPVGGGGGGGGKTVERVSAHHSSSSYSSSPFSSSSSSPSYSSSPSSSFPQHGPHQPLLTAGFWLLLLNSLLNPFLYAITSQRFRFFARRLLAKRDSGRGEGGGGGGGGGCGGGDARLAQGGNLFDVSIYSAFLRNLQSPSRRGSLDEEEEESGGGGGRGDLLSGQHFPLTAMGSHDNGGDDNNSRRDSGCSVTTASTCLDSKNSSPVPKHRAIRGASFQGSQFLEVPFGFSNEYSSASSVSLTDDEEGTAHGGGGGGGGGARKASLMSACSFYSDCSVSFCECRRSGSVRACRQEVAGGMAGGNVEDDFVFSSNNKARIRIVLDLV